MIKNCPKCYVGRLTKPGSDKKSNWIACSAQKCKYKEYDKRHMEPFTKDVMLDIDYKPLYNENEKHSLHNYR